MNLQDLRTGLADLADELPFGSDPSVAVIEHRRRRTRRLKLAGAAIPVLAGCLIGVVLLWSGQGSQTVTVGPTTAPGSTLPPESLVAAELVSGGSEDISVISRATGQTLKRLASGVVLYSGSALTTSTDGSVYFASYHASGSAVNASGVSAVSPSGTITSIAAGATQGAVSQDGNYVAFYQGPFVSDPTGPPPTIEVINRANGQTRSLDLAQLLGSGYSVIGLVWTAGSTTLVADAEIITPPYSCPMTTPARACPAPVPPQQPVLAVINTTAASLTAQVIPLKSPSTLVGSGSKPDTVVLQVPAIGQRGSELVVAQLAEQSQSQSAIARLPSGVQAQSLDPAGNHLLYLQGYHLAYATITNGTLSDIHQIPGTYVAATWSRPPRSYTAPPLVSGTSCPETGSSTRVPSVTGLTAEIAYKVLAENGLLAGTRPIGGGVGGPAPPIAEPGSVVTQEPAAGTTSEVGDKVILDIAVNSTASSGGDYPGPPSSLPMEWCRTG